MLGSDQFGVKANQGQKGTTMRILCGLLAIGALGLMAPAASAQSVPDVVRAITAAHAVEGPAMNSAKNLTQMQRVLSQNEKDATHTVLSAQSEFGFAYRDLIDVGQLLVFMKCAEDQSIARKYFREASLNVVTLVDEEVNYINVFLPSITTPAALAEATKMRDAMIEVRNLFAPFAT